MLIAWPKVAYVPCFILVTNQEMYIFYVLSSTVTNVCVAKEIARAKCLYIFEETWAWPQTVLQKDSSSRIAVQGNCVARLITVVYVCVIGA